MPCLTQQPQDSFFPPSFCLCATASVTASEGAALHSSIYRARMLRCVHKSPSWRAENKSYCSETPSCLFSPSDFQMCPRGKNAVQEDKVRHGMQTAFPSYARKSSGASGSGSPIMAWLHRRREHPLKWRRGKKTTSDTGMKSCT
jgi:hypothetical protein